MAQLASIRQMSRQVSRGSAGEYQADEQADVAVKWSRRGEVGGVGGHVSLHTEGFLSSALGKY